MKLQIVQADQRQKAEIAVLPYWDSKPAPLSAFSKKGLDEGFLSLLEKDFEAKANATLFSYTTGNMEKKVLLLGLGKKESACSDTCRHAFATVAQICRKKKISSMNLYLPEDVDDCCVEVILDGLSQANYSYDLLKRESLKENPTVFLQQVYLIGAKKDFSALIAKNENLMLGVNLARDLVNGNADDVTASYLASLAQEMGKKYSSVEVKVLRQKELEAEKMGLMLAVNRGAATEPALILMHYQGDPTSKDLTAVVGKGVTYDTGGLNLKPTGSMETMKADMGGSAAVMGILQACVALKVRKNIIAVIGSVENAIDSNAYKPGDVYISHSGKSVEITNTDAEGRLVLADAVSYVQKHYKLSRLVDFATLTGGVLVALGEEATGLFSNNEDLTSRFKAAAKVTGERVWELPLYPEHLTALKSPIADLKNARKGRNASSSSGAMFIKQFIKDDLPWTHMDIAGTAYLSETSAYNPSYATGVGVRLMVEFLSKLS